MVTSSFVPYLVLLSTAHCTISILPITLSRIRYSKIVDLHSLLPHSPNNAISQRIAHHSKQTHLHSLIPEIQSTPTVTGYTLIPSLLKDGEKRSQLGPATDMTFCKPLNIFLLCTPRSSPSLKKCFKALCYKIGKSFISGLFHGS